MNKKIVFFGILVLLWMGFIFFMSSMNTVDSNSASKNLINNVIEKVDVITKSNDETINHHKTSAFMDKVNLIFRKFSHASVYLALSILLFNFLLCLFKTQIWIYDLITLLFCFLYACSDEYHQTFVIGRTGSFTDVLIDTSGALVGCLIISLVYYLVKRKIKRKKVVYG